MPRGGAFADESLDALKWRGLGQRAHTASARHPVLPGPGHAEQGHRTSDGLERERGSRRGLLPHRTTQRNQSPAGLDAEAVVAEGGWHHEGAGLAARPGCSPRRYAASAGGAVGAAGRQWDVAARLHAGRLAHGGRSGSRSMTAALCGGRCGPALCVRRGASSTGVCRDRRGPTGEATAGYAICASWAGCAWALAAPGGLAPAVHRPGAAGLAAHCGRGDGRPEFRRACWRLRRSGAWRSGSGSVGCCRWWWLCCACRTR